MADAFQAKHSKLEQLKEEVSKLTTWVSKIATQWGNSGLPEARAFSSDACGFVKHISLKISGDPPKTDTSSQAAQAPSSYADAIKSNGGAASAAIPPAKPQQPAAKSPLSSKPPWIFICPFPLTIMPRMQAPMPHWHTYNSFQSCRWHPEFGKCNVSLQASPSSPRGLQRQHRSFPIKLPLKVPSLGPQWRLNRSGRLTPCTMSLGAIGHTLGRQLKSVKRQPRKNLYSRQASPLRDSLPLKRTWSQVPSS